MRQSLTILGLVVHVLMLPTPTQASSASRFAQSQVQQTNVIRNDSTGTMAFLSDVKQTIWEIPEPATLLLLGTGLAAASRFMQRRRRSL